MLAALRLLFRSWVDVGWVVLFCLIWFSCAQERVEVGDRCICWEGGYDMGRVCLVHGRFLSSDAVQGYFLSYGWSSHRFSVKVSYGESLRLARRSLLDFLRSRWDSWVSLVCWHTCGLREGGSRGCRVHGVLYRWEARDVLLRSLVLEALPLRYFYDRREGRVYCLLLLRAERFYTIFSRVVEEAISTAPVGLKFRRRLREGFREVFARKRLELEHRSSFYLRGDRILRLR
ncbi:MAG: hypothetical protein D6805_04920 [Planctomycetota bacterium]|nr:MAG: hypothetical protein D6805_04920 [Planctomycetota bacterium]